MPFRTTAIAVCLALMIPLHAFCEEKDSAPAFKAPVRMHSAVCTDLLSKIRTIRDGRHPCKTDGDCAVWHNGVFWDGCPTEVNRENLKKLEALRRRFDTLGCSADTNGDCAPLLIKACAGTTCGREP